MWNDVICINDTKKIKISHKAFLKSYNKALQKKAHNDISRIIGCSNDTLSSMVDGQGYDFVVYNKVLILAEILAEHESQTDLTT